LILKTYNIGKKEPQLDTHLPNESIRGFDLCERDTSTKQVFICFNRDNQIFIYDALERETLSEVSRPGGWGTIKYIQSVLGSTRHFLVRDHQQMNLIAPAVEAAGIKYNEKFLKDRLEFKNAFPFLFSDEKEDKKEDLTKEDDEEDDQYSFQTLRLIDHEYHSGVCYGSGSMCHTLHLKFNF